MVYYDYEDGSIVVEDCRVSSKEQAYKLLYDLQKNITRVYGDEGLTPIPKRLLIRKKLEVLRDKFKEEEGVE